MNCGICSACDVGKKCCKRMLLGSAAFNEPVCIPRSRSETPVLCWDLVGFLSLAASS